MEVHSSDLQARDQFASAPSNNGAKTSFSVHMNADLQTNAATGASAAGSSRLRKLAATGSQIFVGEPARVLARLLICSYYVNLVFAELEIYQHLHSPAAQRLMKRWKDDQPEVELPFPYLHVFGLLPVAVLTGVGLLVPWLFAGLLLAFTVAHDAVMTWGHLKNMVLHTGRPTELVMKQFALIGSAALVLAYSIRDSPGLKRVTAVAGLLRADDQQRAQPGVKRSTLLLLCRLLVAALLMYAGYSQVLRIKARADAARFAASLGHQAEQRHHFGRPDGHDNSWLLLQCLLGIPFALGLWTTGVSRLLFAVLLLEAVTSWAWWGSGFPSWHYRQHVRDHFFTNVAVAGGLLLMQSFGAGVFTIDSLLQKQD